MAYVFKQLCFLSVFFGAALSLMPEGGAKRAAELACTAGLILVLIVPFRDFDMESYMMESTRLHQNEESIISKADDVEKKMNRLVIEEGYETYISNKAKELGLSSLKADVELIWSVEGLWLPEKAVMKGSFTEQQSWSLSAIIEYELGIPAERQQWINEG